MPYRRTTFSKFVIEDLRRNGSPNDTELAALLNDLQRAGKLIAAAVSRGALDTPGALVTTSVQRPGATPEPLSQVINKIMIGATEWGGQLCGMVSGALGEPYIVPQEYPHGPYMLMFDPLDGAGNNEVGLPGGAHGHHARRRRARLHAGPRGRRLYADASQYAYRRHGA